MQHKYLLCLILDFLPDELTSPSEFWFITDTLRIRMFSRQEQEGFIRKTLQIIFSFACVWYAHSEKQDRGYSQDKEQKCYHIKPPEKYYQGCYCTYQTRSQINNFTCAHDFYFKIMFTFFRRMNYRKNFMKPEELFQKFCHFFSEVFELWSGIYQDIYSARMLQYIFTDF